MPYIIHRSLGQLYDVEGHILFRKWPSIKSGMVPEGGVVAPCGDLVLCQSQYLFGPGIGIGDVSALVHSGDTHRACFHDHGYEGALLFPGFFGLPDAGDIG
ncbi:MAG: hypothetical protein ABIJ86_14785 [Spirochaetota bacterium]